MKLQEAIPAITDGLESRSFGIQFNGHIAKLLSDDLYTDKVRAVVRELCTNAWDASGGEPFEVWLPTRLEPNFIVRDYGIGLDEEGIYQLYTTYFASEARKSDDGIGGFGLGSKSPMCLSDTFNVTSVYNGKSSTYLIYKDGDMPKVSKVFEEATDAPTGLTVNVPCKDTSQFPYFRQMMARTLDTLPIKGGEVTVNNGGAAYDYEVKALLREEFLKIKEGAVYSGINNGVDVVLKGVAYPVNFDAVRSSMGLVDSQKMSEYLDKCWEARNGAEEVWDSEYLMFLGFVDRSSIRLFAESGKVYPAMSREALSLDDASTKYVMDQVVEIFFQVVEKVSRTTPKTDGKTFFDRMDQIPDFYNHYAAVPELAPTFNLAHVKRQGLSEASDFIDEAIPLNVNSYSASAYIRASDIISAYKNKGDVYKSYNPNRDLMPLLKKLTEVERIVVIEGYSTAKYRNKIKNACDESFMEDKDTVYLFFNWTDQVIKHSGRPEGLTLFKTPDGLPIKINRPYTVNVFGGDKEVIVTSKGRSLALLKGKDPDSQPSRYTPRVRGEASKPRPIRLWKDGGGREGVYVPTIERLSKPVKKDDDFYFIPAQLSSFSGVWENRLHGKGFLMQGCSDDMAYRLNNISQLPVVGLVGKVEDFYEELAKVISKVQVVGLSGKEYAKLPKEVDRRSSEVEALVAKQVLAIYRKHHKASVVKTGFDLRALSGRGFPYGGEYTSEATLEQSILKQVYQSNGMQSKLVTLMPKKSWVRKYFEECHEMYLCPCDIERVFERLSDPHTADSGNLDKLGKLMKEEVIPKYLKPMTQYAAVYLPRFPPSNTSEEEKDRMYNLLFK